MRNLSCLVFASALVCAGCGGTGNDPGDGSHTLEVHANVDIHDGGADFQVTVRRGAQDVSDATVVMTSGAGKAPLSADPKGHYHGNQSGASSYYAIDVKAGNDWLNGSVAAPDPAPVTSPDPTKAFDPHAAPNGSVVLVWAGTTAGTVRVTTKDYHWQGLDKGQLTIPATEFKDDHQDVNVQRTIQVPLAGGTSGSTLSAGVDTQTTLAVANPY